MDKLLLRLVSLFYPVLAKTGVDTEQLDQILRVKILMDNRRPKAMFAVRKGAKKDGQQSPWLVSILTLLMGFFIGLLLMLNQKHY